MALRPFGLAIAQRLLRVFGYGQETLAGFDLRIPKPEERQFFALKVEVRNFETGPTGIYRESVALGKRLKPQPSGVLCGETTRFYFLQHLLAHLLLGQGVHLASPYRLVKVLQL